MGGVTSTDVLKAFSESGVPFRPFEEAKRRRIVVGVVDTEAQDGVLSPTGLTLSTLAGCSTYSPRLPSRLRSSIIIGGRR